MNKIKSLKEGIYLIKVVGSIPVAEVYFNQILSTSYSTGEDVSINPNDQNENNSSSSNRATRTMNLDN